MTAMPRKKPLFVFCETSRHGQRRWYFRRGKGKRIRLPDLNSPEFDAAYRQCLLESGMPPQTTRRPPGTLAWLVERYQDSSTWEALSKATQRQRINIFRHVIETAGSHPVERITKAAILSGRERRKATPAQARNFLDAMRGLFRWAVDAGLAQADPTDGIANPKRRKGPGFAAWTTEDVAAYCSHWPSGTRQRVWLAVLLETGLRRGDAVRLGKQHIRDGLITIRTEKTGQEVYIPVTPALASAIEVGPCGDLALICGDGGKPLTKESFGNAFSAAARSAGVRKSAHGLRKLKATAMVEEGATGPQLEAILGWHGGTMASHYTRNADRKRMAVATAERIGNRETPHPEKRAPHPKKRG